MSPQNLYLISAEEDSVICTALFTEWEAVSLTVHHKFEQLVAARDNRDKFDHQKLAQILVCTGW